MKYFIDTEFIEGFYKPLFGKRRHFIDLISIGIVCEDGREYYAISKDFDLEDVWDKYDLKPDINEGGMEKVYWLRDNVLKHLFNNKKFNYYENIDGFNGFKNLVNHFGKSNKQIAEEIISFVNDESVEVKGSLGGVQFLSEQAKKVIKQGYTEPEFYGYYADYDWVLFCSLFGRMIDLPKGFPMYCYDLKQMLDDKSKRYNILDDKNLGVEFKGVLPEENIKLHPKYPKQINEHNALSDAKWNKKLHEFLIKL